MSDSLPELIFLGILLSKALGLSCKEGGSLLLGLAETLVLEDILETGVFFEGLKWDSTMEGGKANLDE
jgi:hypothetical protein